MSLKIRLSKNRGSTQSFRIVVLETRSKRDGKNIDTLGFYYPKTNPPTVRINKEKYQKWISLGAKPSETVQKLMKGSLTP